MRCAISAIVLTFVVGAAGCRVKAVTPSTPMLAPPSDVIASVRQAKKIFVLNGGEMMGFLGTYPYGQLVCYNEFYTALARTQQFQLVQDPADADLVVIIQGIQTTDYEPDTRPHSPSNYYAIDYPATVVLSLLPRGAKEPVYSMSAVPSAAKKDPEKKLAIAEAISGLTNRLNALAGASVTLAPVAELVQATAPVPDKVLAGKRVFVMNDPNPPLDYTSAAVLLVPFSDALRASNRYTVLPSMQGAELVFKLSWNTGPTVRIFDGSTMKQLWTVSNPNLHYDGRGQKLLQNEAAGIVSAFFAMTSTPY